VLRTILISPDIEFANHLEEAVTSFGRMAVLKKVHSYPDASELLRLIRAYAPQVVFLGLESVGQAAQVAEWIQRDAPGVQIVMTHRTCDPQLLLEAMRMGIREFVSLPVTRESIWEMQERLEDQIKRRPPTSGATDLLFAFLPAKPGVGCSTIAVNTSAALSRQPDTKSLLIDFDLSSGIVRFMLKLQNHYSVVDACERASTLDDEIWPQLVSHRGEWDILDAGNLQPNIRVEGLQVRYLLEFCRRQYKVICVDLSGNLERYSQEVMHEAKRIFLVTTPEVPSLHLAREKCAYLQSLDLLDRVALLVNRVNRKNPITTPQIEQLLGVSVAGAFPNDYVAVQDALQEGTVVNPGTDLGKQFEALARSLLGAPEGKEATKPARRSLAEYLSIFPGRLGLAEGKKSSI